MSYFVLTNLEYSFDASAQTITLANKFSNITKEQILSIRDLTSSEQIYDSRDTSLYDISISGGVITYTYGNTNHVDTDNIQIIVDATPGYNAVLNAFNMVEQAPLDQQPLDPNPVLNAVTTAQTSTYTTVLDKQRLTVIVNVTSGATGGTITLKTKNSAGTAISVPFIDIADDSINASKVCTTGSYIFKLPADITIKELAVGLESVTDGTFTADILGGAL